MYYLLINVRKKSIKIKLPLAASNNITLRLLLCTLRFANIGKLNKI